MKLTPKKFGPFLVALLAVYSGPAKLGVGATSDDQSVDARSSATAPARVPAAPAQAGISVTNNQPTADDSGKVEIHVNDTNLLEVLRMLSLHLGKNVVASKNVTGNVTVNLYNVTVPEALDAILQSKGYAYREKGNFIYVYTARELADLDKSSRATSSEVFRLYYTPAADAADLIKPALSPGAQVAIHTVAQSRIDSTDSCTGGNSDSSQDMLVVTDYTENLSAVKKIIEEVDQRPRQLMIDATILAATLGDNNAKGVDVSAMGGVNFGLLTTDVSAFVQSLESKTHATVLADLKVLLLDRQKMYVHLGGSEGYEPASASCTTPTQIAPFPDSGTTVAFLPSIGNDSYIRMEIQPEQASNGPTRANLPFKTQIVLTTNMILRDGQTVVIGGIFRDVSTIIRSQVPVLGSIPLVGGLFRWQQDQTVRQEIIILLTPHILKDGSTDLQLTEDQLKHVGDLSAGMRP